MLGFELTMSVTIGYRSAVTTHTIVQNVIVEFSLQSYICQVVHCPPKPRVLNSLNLQMMLRLLKNFQKDCSALHNHNDSVTDDHLLKIIVLRDVSSQLLKVGVGGQELL